MAWKRKAAELQKKLGAMAAQHEQEKLSIKEDKDIRYQNLCDTYEAKMMEVTMQIDDARAVGYDAGIQESEAIIASMRQAADEEIERLTQQIVRVQQQEGVPPGAHIEETGGGMGLENREGLYQLKAALSLKSQTLATVSAERVAVETLLLSKEEEIAALTAQLDEATRQLKRSNQGDDHADMDDLKQAKASLTTENAQLKEQLEATAARVSALEARLAQEPQAALNASSESQASAAEETRKEIELWRIRALKMKKAKELVEAELQTMKERVQSGDSASNRESEQQLLAKVAELEKQRDALSAEAGALFARGVAEAKARSEEEIRELTHKLAEASTALNVVEEDAFQRGLAAGKSELEAQLHKLQAEAARSYDAGYEASAVVSEKEIDLLRTEIAVLRAGNTVEEMTDSETEPDIIWGDPVPVLGEEFSDTDAVSASIDNLHPDSSSETWNLKSPASVDAPRDDWGEW